MTIQQNSEGSGATITPLKAGAMIEFAGARSVAEIDTSTVIDAYNAYGAVLLRGLDVDRPDFVAFTEQYSNNFMEYVGGANNDRDSAYGGNKTVLTVTGGAVAKLAIPLHGEMFYTQPRPQALFFCCIRPADERGETTICDGVSLWSALPEAARTLFTERKLKYRRIYTDESWKAVYKVDNLEAVKAICAKMNVLLTVNSDGSIETVHSCYAYNDHKAGRAFINSVLVWAAREYIAGIDDSKVRFEDDSELPKSMLMDINGIAETLTLNISWEPGMVAVVDNMRVLHGRRAYQDTGRDIIMRLSAESLSIRGA
jgi:alpha-ketoglutarate-dependent taurine dioxygenase